MILTAEQIRLQVEKGGITISPFNKVNLNPNSYNFSLSDRLLTYKEAYLDTRKANPTIEHTIPDEGFVLSPGELYLGMTAEVIGSDYFIPLIYGRSSIGRMGLFVQITAPIGDLGYLGNWTLQLTPIRKIRVYRGMRIGQVVFFVPKGKIDLYSGKYQNSRSPTASKSYQDQFFRDDSNQTRNSSSD